MRIIDTITKEKDYRNECDRGLETDQCKWQMLRACVRAYGSIAGESRIKNQNLDLNWGG